MAKKKNTVPAYDLFSAVESKPVIIEQVQEAVIPVKEDITVSNEPVTAAPATIPDFTPPAYLLIVSDGNELKFNGFYSANGKNKQDFYAYLYTKSNSKLGTKLELTKQDIETGLRKEIFKVLEK